jgi:Na+-driven multidrug efflux pump
MPGVAYSTAATPLVGQNLGAGKPDRAAHSAWVATGQAVGIMAVVGTLFLLIPRTLAAPFKPDATVLPMIVSYLMINSFSEPFLALNMVLRGALQGAGGTLAPMLIILGSLWVLRIPLQWFLAIHLKMGAPGAWWAMSITCCLTGLMMMLWFRFGGWQNRQL